MKKHTRIIKLLGLGALIAALVLGAYSAGRRSGINHAILNAEIFTVELYDPATDEDQTVYLELDGDVHEYTMWQG